MASLRTSSRKDGSTYTSVLYRLNGKQTSTSFDDPVQAVEFKRMVDQLGAAKALEVIETTDAAARHYTLSEWLRHYLDHKTGVEKSTIYDYEKVVAKDIDPVLGPIPLAALTGDDIAKWVQALADRGLKGKTISNKHGFLSSALNAAVRAGRIPGNPAAGARLPRTEKAEMVFLTREQYAKLHDNITLPWQPLVEFLVASGARWGEVVALRPSDVNRDASTVRISRASKRTYAQGSYSVGAPKTNKSRRTINVDASVLDKLDYTREYLFTNTVGNPVRHNNFHANVWQPALKRAGLDVKPRVHDLRHTCASWLIAAGLPLLAVRDHLGHESIKITVDTYGHLDRTNGQAVAAAIAAQLDPARG
ncbi:tyrosine integrase [Mycobacterium phage Asayake]|nr:tyrosine integrase [Mycobacterium phage BEEST]QWY80028.1 tyrosine integrase [Mycobacterium phage Asayake]QWY81145.1 tyrosine integrase [Mycobacterium phage Blizzard]QWY81241.1 tyrosine integrase [Mycobacterium phage Durfee]QWY82637.1 tyrosine integrase [Mycobacterium phage Padfoot]UDL15103.1 tyrosine integrase [Mycobacterium phage CaseJules]UGL63392.1 tyrosine integrase [Mycobacterium phage Boiiii]UOK18263.1 tyrosine integrase [Mycobacterium phage Hyperbowlee]UQS94518.1 tyrosine integras